MPKTQIPLTVFTNSMTKNLPKHIAKIVLIFLPFLFIWGQSRPWQPYLKDEPIEFSIPPLDKETIQGVTIYYRQSNLLPKVDISLIFEGGQYEEPENLAGITSIWGETLKISGSKKHPREELAAFFEQRGSSFGFSAGFERSMFMLSSLSPYFNEDLDVVFGVMLEPLLADEDLNLMQRHALEGIKQRTQQPAGMAYLAARLIEWKDEIRGVASTSKSIGSITRDDIQKWQSKMVSKKRLSILVTGDFNKEELFAYLNQKLSQLSEAPAPGKDALYVKNDQRAKRSKGMYLLPKEIPQTSILFRAPGITHGHKDYYALKLYDFILGGNSFNSYLTQVIRTKNGWAYAVYSHYSAEAYAGSITIFAQTANKNVPDVITSIRKILENPSEFLTQEALDEAKRSLRNRFVFLAETPEKLAALQLSLEWEGLPENYLDGFLDSLDKVTLKEVYAIAQKYYAYDNFFITLVGPDPHLETKETKETKIETYVLPQ